MEIRFGDIFSSGGFHQPFFAYTFLVRGSSSLDFRLHKYIPTLADLAAGFRGGGKLGRGPNLGYPKN